LQDENNKRGKNDPPVFFPQRLRTKSNNTIGWQAAFADAPPFQGAPIEHRHGIVADFERQRRSRGAGQNKPRQFTRPIAKRVDTRHGATDSAGA
jgi:hypothetical protein